MERLDTRTRTLWIATGTLMGAIFGAIIAFALMIADLNMLFGIASIVILAASFGYFSILRYRRWGFELRDDHIYLEHGVLWKTTSMVPHVRIQNTDTVRGPLYRFLGLSSLVVYTAGSKGADIKIPGIDYQRADELQDILKDQSVESGERHDGV
ncbi:MAG: PH domain-containing protein [Candidatus Nanohaloarchaea archaeon]